MSMDERIEEILRLAKEEGIKLPYSPKVIVGLEDRGKYVDITTGLIGDSNERIELTVLGEATKAIWDID